MKITLERKDKELCFLGKTEDGLTTIFDSAATGYSPEAPGPMQNVLMAAAACSSIDVVLILKKMKQELVDIKVEAEAQRAEVEPKTFTKINLHYKLFGSIEKDKADKALKLSVEKYCSVLQMLDKTAQVCYTFEIVANEK